jgi:hypothetical protein
MLKGAPAPVRVAGEHLVGRKREQVLTNAGALDRDKQLAVVDRLSAIVAQAAADPSLVDRTWLLLTEAPDGGWGLAGHANTNEELVAAALAKIADLRAQKPASRAIRALNCVPSSRISSP